MRYLNRYREAIELCTESINLPTSSNILFDDFAVKPHLQRRFTEVYHERKWETHFLRLNDVENRVRRLEALGPLSRAWLQVVPTDQSLSVSDAETRHGYRYLMLNRFPELGPSVPSNMCERCYNRPGGQQLSPLHFLSCDRTQALRSRRHHAVTNALALRFQEVYSTPAIREANVGEYINREGRSIRIRSDIQIRNNEGVTVDYDVGVTTIHGPRAIAWPTDTQVRQALTERETRIETAMQRRVRGGRGFDAGNSNDTFDSITHPDTKRIATFRQLAWNTSVLPNIREMHDSKFRHYQRGNAAVTPLVMTAGGSVSEVTRDVLHQLCRIMSPNDSSERAEFRRRIYGRVSVLLLRFAHSMAMDQLRFFGAYGARSNVRGGMGR
jgi:hypothetical protein